MVRKGEAADLAVEELSTRRVRPTLWGQTWDDRRLRHTSSPEARSQPGGIEGLASTHMAGAEVEDEPVTLVSGLEPLLDVLALVAVESFDPRCGVSHPARITTSVKSGRRAARGRAV